MQYFAYWGLPIPLVIIILRIIMKSFIYSLGITVKKVKQLLLEIGQQMKIVKFYI